MSSVLRHWFAQPLLLWGLAVLPALAALALWARRRRRRGLALLGGGLAFDLGLPRRSLLRLLRNSLFFFGLVLLVAGTAGPQWGRDWGQSAAPGRDLVVVLDLSRSMLAENPSRLERGKRALLGLADAVRQRGGHRLALVVFAGHAKLVCPLTHDCAHFRNTIESFDRDHLDPTLWPEENAPSGTRFGEALTVAVDAFDAYSRGVQDILLVSDGDDPALDDSEWLRGVHYAVQHKVPVTAVGVGDPEKASSIPFGEKDVLLHDGTRVMTKLEEKPLREIARRTEGIYERLADGSAALGRLFFERMATGSIREHGDDALPVYRQRYAWFLAPAFVFLALSMAVGDRRPRPAARRIIAV